MHITKGKKNLRRFYDSNHMLATFSTHPFMSKKYLSPKNKIKVQSEPGMGGSCLYS
jgi:hypothetical protein